MRLRYLPLGLVVLSSTWMGVAAAQTPTAWPADRTSPLLAASGTNTAGGLPQSEPAVTAPWHFDLLLGLPSGLRAQRGLDAGGGSAWLAEGFVGLEVIFPVVGGGVRRSFTPCCGEHNALALRPGLDAYLLVNPFSDGLLGGPAAVGLFTADLDVLWWHGSDNGSGSEVGVKLGAGAGYGRRWGVLPILSIFAGFCF